MTNPTPTTDHDDGLVHSHSWACTERGREAHVNRPAPAPEPELDHDDGLVHSHGWASSERGKEAHRG